jgi:hypothetical protein
LKEWFRRCIEKKKGRLEGKRTVGREGGRGKECGGMGGERRGEIKADYLCGILKVKCQIWHVETCTVLGYDQLVPIWTG